MITHKDINHLSDITIHRIYNQAVDHFDNAIFVELGCFTGGSTIYLAQKIKEKKKNIIVYAVDIWEGETKFSDFWNNVVAAECDDIIKPIQFDSSFTGQAFGTSDFGLRYFDIHPNFVFVDANHEKDYCWSDIYCWLDKLKYGDWIGGHDWYQQSVADAVLDHFEKKDVELFEDETENNKLIAKKSWLVKL